MKAAAVSTPSLVEHSLWDKLLDDEARVANSIDTNERHSISHVKASLARDLEALLNTRCLDPDNLLEDFPLARQSVLAYGVPDFTNLCVTNPDHQVQLRRYLTDAIKVHEPRLSNVAVQIDTGKGTERMLRFRVDAVLKVHPRKPPVTFDATLQLSSHAYSVKSVV